MNGLDLPSWEPDEYTSRTTIREEAEHGLTKLVDHVGIAVRTELTMPPPEGLQGCVKVSFDRDICVLEYYDASWLLAAKIDLNISQYIKAVLDEPIDDGEDDGGEIIDLVLANP